MRSLRARVAEMAQDMTCDCGAALEGRRKRCEPCQARVRRETKRRWRTANADRVAAYDRAYKAANVDRVNAQRRARRDTAQEARWKLVTRYGITPEEWDSLLASQGGGCAVCRTHAPGGRGWHTDHDHATLRVRGILCGRCNVGVGMLADDPSRLRAAADYLESAG